MSQQTTSAAGERLRNANRLVLKVGSSILCGEEGVHRDWLASLAGELAALRAKGVEIVIVSSGAIALGRRQLKLGRGLRLDEKQAASAAGQASLMQAWQTAFAETDAVVAQILITLDDTEDRRRYLNARSTFRTLLDLGAIPVVNENDTVATSEIRYGDNDRLAAHAAQLLEADTLLILSDVDGVYDADPRTSDLAKRYDVIEAITPEIENAAAGPNAAAGVGSGGMESKLAAATIAVQTGCAVIIAPGHIDQPLSTVLSGGPATLIRETGSASNARQRWIAGRLKPAGALHIDTGAAKALRDGASLLPAGVVLVDGSFARGDAVSLIDPGGARVGQGLAAYDSDEIERIAGRKSDEIEKLLGYRRRPAVVEKNDMALVGKSDQ